MANEYESMARILMSSPQGAKIVKGLDKLNTTASSPAGKQLLQLLAGGGTELLKTACDAASKADHDAGRVLLSNLMTTKEGTALVAQFIEVMGV